MDSPRHIISAQICEIGVTPASEAVEGKSNEIPAVLFAARLAAKSKNPNFCPGQMYHAA